MYMYFTIVVYYCTINHQAVSEEAACFTPSARLAELEALLADQPTKHKWVQSVVCYRLSSLLADQPNTS